MEIQETRSCNRYNLQNLAKYYGVNESIFLDFYRELQEDKKFLNETNAKIVDAAKRGFTKGLFSKGAMDSVDWFAFQRVLLYTLLRHLKPKYCLETGVFYGGNSAFILNALYKNKQGTLISIDLPDSKVREMKKDEGETIELSRHPFVGDSELYDTGLKPGFMIPDYLREHWKFIEGSSLDVIPTLKETFDFYIHDSDHSYDFLNQEISHAMKKMSPKGSIVVDDLNWSNSFYKFCVEGKYFPICFTDNGKQHMIVRTGLVYLGHPNNNSPAITGSR